MLTIQKICKCICFTVQLAWLCLNFISSQLEFVFEQKHIFLVMVLVLGSWPLIIDHEGEEAHKWLVWGGGFYSWIQWFKQCRWEKCGSLPAFIIYYSYSAYLLIKSLCHEGRLFTSTEIDLSHISNFRKVNLLHRADKVKNLHLSLIQICLLRTLRVCRSGVTIPFSWEAADPRSLTAWLTGTSHTRWVGLEGEEKGESVGTCFTQ